MMRTRGRVKVTRRGSESKEWWEKRTAGTDRVRVERRREKMRGRMNKERNKG